MEIAYCKKKKTNENDVWKASDWLPDVQIAEHSLIDMEGVWNGCGISIIDVRLMKCNLI